MLLKTGLRKMIKKLSTMRPLNEKLKHLQEETFDNSKSHLYPVSVFCPIDFADLGLYTR